jgi:curved DNA-binding protein CbpA
MPTIQRDYYKVLQVDPEASPEVITAAFRVLARRLHPDRDLTGVHEIRMAELNRAYGVLRDVGKRRDYDLERAQSLSPMGPGFQEEEPAPVAVRPPTRSTSVDGSPDGDSMISGLGRMASGSTSPREPGQGAWTPGDTQLDFGRYAGWTLRDIARRDEAYLRWLARHSSGIRFRGEIAKVLREPLDDPYAPSH